MSGTRLWRHSQSCVRRSGSNAALSGLLLAVVAVTMGCKTKPYVNAHIESVNAEYRQLEDYVYSLEEEKAKLQQRALKHKSKTTDKSSEDSDTSSDLEMSVNLIEEVSNTKKQKLEIYKEQSLEDYKKFEEEIAYLTFIYKEDPDSSNGT